jgi:tRNA-specific 2-thiouridylase
VAAEVVRVDADEVELALQEPVAAITPGQSAVLYAGEQLIGGGFIEVATGQRLSLPVLAA